MSCFDTIEYNAASIILGDFRLRRQGSGKMKTTTLFCLSLILVGAVFAQVPRKVDQHDGSAQVFWEKFSAAVVKGDKATVANLLEFPIGMPYGMPSVKNKAQLVQRFRKIFFSETNAAKCFSKARPEIDPSKPKAFEIICKNAAGDDVIIYSFVLTRNGWRLRAFDNINE